MANTTNTNMLAKYDMIKAVDAKKAKAFEKWCNGVSVSLSDLKKSYVKLAKAFYLFKKYGYCTNIINPDTKSPYKPTDATKALSMLTGLQTSQVNGLIQLFQRFYCIYDDSTKSYVESEKPVEIGGLTADNFGQTQLMKLAPLTDDELKNAVDEGLTPNSKMSEVNTIIDKVHKKNPNKIVKKEEKNPYDGKSYMDILTELLAITDKARKANKLTKEEKKSLDDIFKSVQAKGQAEVKKTLKAKESPKESPKESVIKRSKQ